MPGAKKKKANGRKSKTVGATELTGLGNSEGQAGDDFHSLDKNQKSGSHLEDFLDEISDHEEKNEGLRKRRQSMKVRTVGLDLKNAKKMDKNQLSPSNESEKKQLEKTASATNNQQMNGNDVYTSGESGENFHIPYTQLPQKEQKDRVLWFWNIAFKKAKGAAIIVRKQLYQNNRIYLDGYKEIQHVNYYLQKNEVEDDPDLAEKDIEKQKRETSCIIFPANRMKQGWDVLIMFLLLYTALFVPYKVCFEDASSDIQFIFDCWVDSCFFIDIILTFFTATEQSQGILIVNKGALAKNYIKGWFFIDLFTTFPFQVLEKMDFGSGGSADAKVLRLARIPRLYRLLRIFRLFKLLRVMKTNSTSQSMTKMLKLGHAARQMGQIIGAILFVNHIVCCFWFFQAKWSDFQDDSWVIAKGIQNDDPGKQYIVSFYWAFQTLTTVGFGDISGNNNVEYTFGCGWMIFGVGFYSYTIGNMTQMITSIDTDNEELQNKLETLKKFSQTSKIPNRLFYRIKRHLENSQIQQKYQDSEKLLSELPINLRDQVIAKTHGEVFKKIKFFWGRSKEFNNAIVHELKPINLGATELLYQQGDPPEGIYFIHSGKIKLWVDTNDFVKDEELLRVIHEKEMKKKQENNEEDSLQKPSLKAIIQYTEGGYFGDSDIFAQIQGISPKHAGRDASAIGDQDCSIFVLSVKEVRKIKDNFEDIFDEMKEIGVKRFKNHQILIAKEVKAYCIQAKIDAGNASSDDDISDSDSHSNANSLNSERIEQDFQKAVEGLNNDVSATQGRAVGNIDAELDQHSMPVSLAQQKFIDRKRKFDIDFEKTLTNFAVNMNFLETQRQKVSKVVEQIDDKSEDAVHVMNKMNIHMQGIVQDLNEVDGLVDVIKTKKQAARVR